MTSTDDRRLAEGWLRVPTCTFFTLDEAIAHLREAGFTGEIESRTLSADDAWLEAPPGRVTLTMPYAPQVVAPDAPFVVFVNPGEARPLTEDERRHRASLEAQHARELDARSHPWAAEQLKLRMPPALVLPRPPAATVLTKELIARLVDRLRVAGANVADRLAPGLRDSEIDRLARPAGLILPEEARVWWRWQNGVQDDGPPWAALGWHSLFSLETAIELWEEGRDASRQVWEVDGLLPIASDRPKWFFECLGPVDAPVPVYAQDDIETPQLALASIGELVLAFIELLDSGAWSVTDGNTWTLRDEKVPDRLRARLIY